VSGHDSGGGGECKPNRVVPWRPDDGCGNLSGGAGQTRVRNPSPSKTKFGEEVEADMARVIRTKRRSADELLIRAEKLDTRAANPDDRDDAGWLRRRAENMRQFALKRSKSRMRRAEERRKNA
jgi:hypothetical protein